MTTPWPKIDYDNREVMCCLCFSTVSFDELSMTPERQLTDVCMGCRANEIMLMIIKLCGVTR